MTKKIGRNDPCPCGSGKKYKKCCLLLHQRDERELREAIPVPGAEPMSDGSVPIYTALDLLANSVQAHIKAGRLEEAEQACSKLKRRYPDQIDWMERTADVASAKGDHARAAEHYRMAAEVARTSPGFDEDYAAWLLEQADRAENT